MVNMRGRENAIVVNGEAVTAAIDMGNARQQQLASSDGYVKDNGPKAAIALTSVNRFRFSVGMFHHTRCKTMLNARFCKQEKMRIMYLNFLSKIFRNYIFS